MGGTSWLDDAPEAQWLDEAPEAAPVDTRVTPEHQEQMRRALSGDTSGLGGLRAAIGGYVQGLTGGFADELGGVAGSAGALGSLPGKQGSGGYKENRDLSRQQFEQMKKEHPWLYGGGEILGGASMPLGIAGKAAKGATLGARIIGSAKAALPLGLIYGAGNSQADTIGGLAGDTAAGGAASMLLGGGLPIVGAGVRKIAAPVADYLKKKALEQGTKSLLGLINPMSAKAPPSPEAVERALKTGAVRPLGTVEGNLARLEAQRDAAEVPYGQMLDRMESKGVTGPDVRPFAGELGQRAGELDANTYSTEAGQSFRKLAKHLTTKTVKGPEVQPKVIAIRQEVGGAAAPKGLAADQAVAASTADAAADAATAADRAAYLARTRTARTHKEAADAVENAARQAQAASDAVADAERLASFDPATGALGLRPRTLPGTNRPLPADVSGVHPVIEPGTPANWNLGLRQAENIKKSLQDAASREYDKRTGQRTLSGEMKIELASRMRQAIEDAVESQASKAPEDVAAFVPAKKDLGLIYNALRAADEGAGRSARRSPISLTGTMAGSAVKASGGGAFQAIAAALGHDALKKRLPSTVASGAYGLSRLVRGAGNLTPAAQDEAGRFAALIAALRGPGARLEPLPAGAGERRDR